MDSGACGATVHGVTKELDTTEHARSCTDGLKTLNFKLPVSEGGQKSPPRSLTRGPQTSVSLSVAVTQPLPVPPAAGAGRTVGVGLGRHPGPQPRLFLGLGPAAVLPAEPSLRLLPAPPLPDLPLGGLAH